MWLVDEVHKSNQVLRVTNVSAEPTFNTTIGVPGRRDLNESTGGDFTPHTQFLPLDNESRSAFILSSPVVATATQIELSVIY